eukprot:GSChrysophyteH1.ASY1.ANO1.1973.1 assembled CDS
MRSLLNLGLVKESLRRGFATKAPPAICQLSSELTAIVGTSTATRQDALKGVWAYIKENNLQDPANKRNIVADEKLQAVFGKGYCTMFEVMKLMSPHVSKID